MIDIKGVLLQQFKKTADGTVKVEHISNKKLAKELHKSFIIDK